MKVVNTNKAPKAIGPYSQAIEANGLIITSGQLPENLPPVASRSRPDSRSQMRKLSLKKRASDSET